MSFNKFNRRDGDFNDSFNNSNDGNDGGREGKRPRKRVFVKKPPQTDDNQSNQRNDGGFVKVDYQKGGFKKPYHNNNNSGDRPNRNYSGGSGGGNRYDRGNNNNNNGDRPNRNFGGGGGDRPFKPYNKGGSGGYNRPFNKQGGGNFRPKPNFKKDETPKIQKNKHSYTNRQLQYDENKEVRLNKFLANAGICSRREADKLITAGIISINDTPVTELGTRVRPGDVVRYNGQVIGREEYVYLLLNKPKDYISTMYDPEGRKTVMDLVGNATKERIFPVGRLDRNTTGLLLFTNDGDLAQVLTHPKFNTKKVYIAVLDKNLTQADMQQILDGFELEDGPINADNIAYIQDDKRKIGIEIHSGRNRIIHRIFEHFGYDVEQLDRVYYGGLTKKDLPRGQHRFLSEKEVVDLKNMASKAQKQFS